MSKFSTLISVFISVVGISLGLSGSIAFYFYGNGWAVFWSFSSACVAILNLHLHYLYLQDKLEEWHSEETMSAIKSLAVVLLFTILGFLLWYIFRIFYEHLSVYPIKDSLIISSVWTFMTAKWTFILMRTSNKYGILLHSLNRPLLTS